MHHPERGDLVAYQRYLAGMDVSMPQKAAFVMAHALTHRGVRILDLGCGSGKLSAMIALIAPEAEVVGIDIDPTSITLARQEYAGLRNVRFEVGDATQVFPGFDVVISCSTEHHIFTYSKTPYDLGAVEAAMQAHIASLNPGGVYILRDFAAEGLDGATCLLDVQTTPHADGQSDLDLLCDFAARARPLDTLGCGFPMDLLGETRPGWARVRLPRQWSAEFLLRRTYRSDWEVELNEQYAFWTPRMAAQSAVACGARVLTSRSVRNPWVVANNFRGQVARFDESGRTLPWPGTNMVLVAQRLNTRGSLRLREQRIDPTPATYLEQTSWTNGAETFDLVQRPTHAVDLLPYTLANGAVQVLARQGWPRPALVMMPRGGQVEDEVVSGHVIEPIALASNGQDLVADMARTTGLTVSDDQITRLPAFLTSAGMLNEVARPSLVRMEALPGHTIAPNASGQPFDTGALHAYDAPSLLRAAEVGMLPEARLELMVRMLLWQLRVPFGAWVGESFSATPCRHSVQAFAPLEAFRASPAPFREASASAGFLRRTRAVFTEDLLDQGRVVKGGEQTLEMAFPTRHSIWTVGVLPVGLDADGAVVIGIEWRQLPAAQQQFGQSHLACIEAWRVVVLPDHPEPLKMAAATQADVRIEDLVPLGPVFTPSLGVSPERIQLFVVPADHHHGSGLQFVRLDDILGQLDTVRDGHLLIALFRLMGMLGLA